MFAVVAVAVAAAAVGYSNFFDSFPWRFSPPWSWFGFDNFAAFAEEYFDIMLDIDRNCFQACIHNMNYFDFVEELIHFLKSWPLKQTKNFKIILFL